MPRIVECVPNFSEGRDIKTINAIAGAITAVPGVKFISAEPDKDYNRTVVTFIGEPGAVVEAAFQGTKTAAELIDMTSHLGEHPRLGATDVVPFIPLRGVEMQDCVKLAHEFGRRVGDELSIPIYLYEEAATKPDRKNLSIVRRGEYEGLADKLKDPAWQPDYGPTLFNAKSGATVTGARVFLIAYNVNLDTNDTKVAKEIAERIRESGRVAKDPDGKPRLDSSGQKITIPGSLKAVKAMGVLLEAQNIAQVSINLTNFHVTPPHIAFEEVRREAARLGVSVTGSELVGLSPLEAMLMAGRFYSPEVSGEMELLCVAEEKLGLSQIDKFDPAKKIIEYQL